LDRLRRQLSLSRGDASHIERDIARVEAELAASESKERDFAARIRKIKGEEEPPPEAEATGPEAEP
jgi:bifunctional DNA-binding transcriptional regulator/antitoxin component of YhaV-PrlF toxin-antitoxin module